MIYHKTAEEIELIRQSCLLVCKTLSHVASILKPGVSGTFLDKEAETLIRDHQAVPAFKGYRGFPGTLCISPNAQVVHGIPTDKALEDGDIVSVDCGVLLNGFYGDSAYTFAIGEVDAETLGLLSVTNASLYKGIEAAMPGKRVGDIGYAIQDFVERKHRYGVVRELVGHGIGKNLHEEPEIPNYGKRGRGPKLQEGLVIAIEPMVNMGRKEIVHGQDGWTVLSKDRKPSAHYEHTIAVQQDGADILSNHQMIELVIKQNPALHEIPTLDAVIQ